MIASCTNYKLDKAALALHGAAWDTVRITLPQRAFSHHLSAEDFHSTPKNLVHFRQRGSANLRDMSL